jgi:hypothetical protein
MKAEELRIGNLLQNKEGNFTIKATPNIIEELWVHGITKYSPVEFTVDLAVEFGFKKIRNSINEECYRRTENNCEYYDIFVDRNKFHLYKADCFITTFEYVHTLQNTYFFISDVEL